MEGEVVYARVIAARRTGNKARCMVCCLADLLEVFSKVQCILPQFFHMALMNLHCTQLLVNSATCGVCVCVCVRVGRGRNGGESKPGSG